MAGQKDAPTVNALIKIGFAPFTLYQEDVNKIRDIMTEFADAFDNWLWSEFMEKAPIGGSIVMKEDWYDWISKLEKDYQMYREDVNQIGKASRHPEVH